MAKFIIMATPRSRSAWLAEWLSFGGKYEVGHDLALECSSVQDFEDALDAVDGSIETGAVLGWRLLRQRRPNLKVATVIRPLAEIDRSFQLAGWITNLGELEMRTSMLEALGQSPGVMALTYADLASEAACTALWEHLLGRDFDFEWWDEMRRKNVQIDLVARMERIRQNQVGLAALRADLIAQNSGAASCGLN